LRFIGVDTTVKQNAIEPDKKRLLGPFQILTYCQNIYHKNTAAVKTPRVFDYGIDRFNQNLAGSGISISFIRNMNEMSEQQYSC